MIYMTPYVGGKAQVDVQIRTYVLIPGAKVTPEVILVDTVPGHAKTQGVLWSTLIGKNSLSLSDDELDGRGKRIDVVGIGSRYERFETECPHLCGPNNVRLRALRLVAPEVLGDVPGGESRRMIVLNIFEGQTMGETLAILLEKQTPIPIRKEWGEHLLRRAVNDNHAKPVISPKACPIAGYVIDGETPWAEYISAGVKSGHLPFSN